MNPINFTHANLALTAPEGWDEEANGPCATLHVYSHDGNLTSVWKPTDQELQVLLNGGAIVLNLIAAAHPVTSLGVTSLEAAPAEPEAPPVVEPDEDEDEDDIGEVEDPHPEVVDPRRQTRALTEDEEHETISDVAARNAERSQ